MGATAPCCRRQPQHVSCQAGALCRSQCDHHLIAFQTNGPFMDSNKRCMCAGGGAMTCKGSEPSPLQTVRRQQCSCRCLVRTLPASHSTSGSCRSDSYLANLENAKKIACWHGQAFDLLRVIDSKCSFPSQTVIAAYHCLHAKELHGRDWCGAH